MRALPSRRATLCPSVARASVPHPPRRSRPRPARRLARALPGTPRHRPPEPLGSAVRHRAARPTPPARMLPDRSAQRSARPDRARVPRRLLGMTMCSTESTLSDGAHQRRDDDSADEHDHRNQQVRATGRCSAVGHAGSILRPAHRAGSGSRGPNPAEVRPEPDSASRRALPRLLVEAVRAYDEVARCFGGRAGSSCSACGKSTCTRCSGLRAGCVRGRTSPMLTP